MAASYAHGIATVPLIGQTIGQLLDTTAHRFPGNEALVSVFEDDRLTYRELRDATDRLARAFLALGVRKGDRVGIWSTNCTHWTLTQFATAKIGAVLVCINPAYQLGELEYALRQSECNYLICGEGFKDTRYVELLRRLLPGLTEEDVASDLRQAAGFPHLRRIIYLSPIPEPGLLSWERLEELAERATVDELVQRGSELDFDDVVNIQYTSGTTGFPKGVMLTHHAILNNGYWAGVRMRFTHEDRLCIPVPFYHCFGMVLANLACVAHGATMVLPAPVFSPIATLEAISREKCTAVHGVPTMFIAELNHPRFREFDLSTLRTGIMAGAPCPVEVMNRVIAQMNCRDITIGCGMTETAPVCNMTEVDDLIHVRVGTVGKVMPHQEQKIVDPSTGRLQPRGAQGELCYRGYNVMQGYYNDPEATRQTIDTAGWLHSGDLAVMDESGYVRITGRIKDMIARGGEKIFPREVEEFLFTHPAIVEAYVIGVPDPYYGEQVMAWVKTRGPMSADELRDYCKGRIMDYKIPKYIKIVDAFPTTVTGKIQKFRMRQISIMELGLAGS